MPGDESSGGFSTLGDLEDAARRRLPPDVWAYIEGGAGEERTVSENHEAFARWHLRPRVLAGLKTTDLRTSLLGTPVPSPIFVAPTAYHGLIHPMGEVATAQAAGEAGVLAMFSTLSSRSLEEIAAAQPRGPRWFQLYLQPDFDQSRDLVERARRAGFTALVLTVDAPVLGPRDRQTRDGVAIRSPVPIGNGPKVVPPARGPEFSADAYAFGPDASADWRVVERLRSVSDLPLVIKGILTAEDARRGLEAGARAVVVSNHGGRQLDRSVPALDALPEVVAAIGGRAEVYVDGGVRRGSDVLIALALGARGVGLGRPVLWGLGAGGPSGVKQVLSLLHSELATCLLLAGRPSVAAVDRSLLAPPAV